MPTDYAARRARLAPALGLTDGILLIGAGHPLPKPEISDAMLPFIALVALARHGACIRPRLTGIAAGLASAGLATVAYALHCPEDALPFVAAWYPLAMAVSATIGALAAPRLLRW